MIPHSSVFTRILPTLACVALGLLSCQSASAAPSQVLFSSQLVRIGDTNTPGGNPLLGFFGMPVGADALGDGTITLTLDRQVSLQLTSASANVTYNALFCRFGFPASPGCLAVGQITTNGGGDGTQVLTFPSAGGASDVWNGSFVLTRDAGGINTAEFISGFEFPPAAPAPSAGVQVQLTGQIQSLNGGTQSFRLVGLAIDIATGGTTKFQSGGIHSFPDLKVGQTVQVSGFTQPGGSIFATDVKLTSPGNDNQDDNSHGKGDN